MSRVLRVGNRLSPLALRQTEEVEVALRIYYPGLRFEVTGFKTPGDRDKTTPLSDVEGGDFFTRDLDEALLEGKIDLAVHSAKDLPEAMPRGLTVAAVTKPLDPSDALVSRGGVHIDALVAGARIGASSLRRKTQLKAYRQDFEIVDVRGTIEERLARMDTDGLDALIVASCALMRLGLSSRIAQRIPGEILTPHPCQGSLAVIVRFVDTRLIEYLKVLDAR